MIPKITEALVKWIKPVQEVDLKDHLTISNQQQSSKKYFKKEEKKSDSDSESKTKLKKNNTSDTTESISSAPNYLPLASESKKKASFSNQALQYMLSLWEKRKSKTTTSKLSPLQIRTLYPRQLSQKIKVKKGVIIDDEAA